MPTLSIYFDSSPILDASFLYSIYFTILPLNYFGGASSSSSSSSSYTSSALGFFSNTSFLLPPPLLD